MGLCALPGGLPVLDVIEKIKMLIATSMPEGDKQERLLELSQMEF